MKDQNPKTVVTHLNDKQIAIITKTLEKEIEGQPTKYLEYRELIGFIQEKIESAKE